jgi:hypothetical protein
MSKQEIPITDGFDFPVGKPEPSKSITSVSRPGTPARIGTTGEVAILTWGLPCTPWPTVWW